MESQKPFQPSSIRRDGSGHLHAPIIALKIVLQEDGSYWVCNVTGYCYYTNQLGLSRGWNSIISQGRALAKFNIFHTADKVPGQQVEGIVESPVSTTRYSRLQTVWQLPWMVYCKRLVLVTIMIQTNIGVERYRISSLGFDVRGRCHGTHQADILAYFNIFHTGDKTPKTFFIKYLLSKSQ